MNRTREIFYRIHSGSFGDTLASTPTLRRLYYAYGDRINIITHNKKVFDKNPHVKRLLSFLEFETLIIENSDYEIFDSFTHTGRKDERGIEKKYSAIDIRQLHSMDLGFQLLPEHMSYDYYPDPVDKTFNEEYLKKLNPGEYVVLHVTSNWDNRTWSYENWQYVIDWLTKKEIQFVIIGMDNKEVLHKSLGADPLLKKCPSFGDISGMDLTNKGSLDDMWYLIDQAACLVTTDSGPLHLAGATDTEIIQLGSAIDWRYRAPYRNGSQEYKYTFIGGSCQLACNSNLFYNVETWGTINAIQPMIGCKEGKADFECHPGPVKVINKLKELCQVN